MIKHKQHLFPGLVLVVTAIVLLIPFMQTLGSVLSLWLNDIKPYSHGLITIVMSLYILSALHMQPFVASLAERILAALTVIVGMFLWAVGSILFFDLLTYVSLPMILFGALYSIFGRFILVPAMFIIALYALSIPLWEGFVNVLQALTVFFAGGLAKMTGITVHIDEIYVHLKSGILAVEGGCAGLHYSLAGLALSLIMAYVRRASLKATVIMVLLGGVIAMIANWLRVYLLIIVADVTSMQHYLISESHVAFGWVVFGILYAPFLALGMRLECIKERPIVPSSVIRMRNVGFAAIVKLGVIFLASVALSLVVKKLLVASHNENPEKIILENSIEQNQTVINFPLLEPNESYYWRYFSKQGSYNVNFYSYYNESRQRNLLEYFNQPFSGLGHDNLEVVKLNNDIELVLSRLTFDGASYLALSGYKIGNAISATRMKARLMRLQNLGYAKGVNGFLVIYKECQKTCNSKEVSTFIKAKAELTELAESFIY